MNQKMSAFVSKVSIPGKSNDELSYVFFDTVEGEQKSDSTTLFGVFHAQSSSAAYHTIIKDTVKYFLDFYHKGGSALSEDSGDVLDQNEFLFENALQYVNEHVMRSLEELDRNAERGRIDYKKIHFILGALSGSTLYLSVTGKAISAFYIYPVIKQKQFSHYAHVAIAENSGDDNDHRLFSNAISGDVSMPRATIVICNQPFLEYITPDQIKQRLAGTAPEALGVSLQNLLSRVNGKSDFSALFIHPQYTPSSSSIMQKTVQTVSHASMQTLNTTQRGTDTILFPALALSIKNGLHLLVRKLIIPLFFFFWTTLKKVNYKSLLLRCISLFRGIARHAPAFGKQFFRFQWLHRLPRHFAESSVALLKTNKKDMFSFLIARSKAIAASLFRRGRELFMALPVASRALFIIGILFIALFTQSVISLQRTKMEKRRLVEGQLLVRTIEQQFDTAEASLIYENEEKARVDINNAETLLAQLPTAIPGYTEEYARLASRAEQLKMKVNKIILIQNPTVVADLSSQIPSLNNISIHTAGTTSMISSPDGVYILDTKNGKALQIDTQAKLPSVGCLAFSSSVAYACDGSKTRLFSVNLKDNTIKTIPITFHAAEKELGIAHLYNQRLYAFDTLSGSVYRHVKKGDVFDVGTDWIRDKKTDLTNVVDFTIDGVVYLLKNDGVILRYTAGKMDGILNPTLDPPTRLFTKIATDSESPNLYALDPSNKRVVALDKKTGVLKNQIISESFSNLKSFALNWQKRELLLLNDASVFRVPIDIQ